jgi:hypothetical protein
MNESRRKDSETAQNTHPMCKDIHKLAVIHGRHKNKAGRERAGARNPDTKKDKVQMERKCEDEKNDVAIRQAEGVLHQCL